MRRALSSMLLLVGMVGLSACNADFGPPDAALPPVRIGKTHDRFATEHHCQKINHPNTYCDTWR